MLKFQMPMKHLNETVQQVPAPAGNLSLEVWINLIITSIYNIETTDTQKYMLT